MSEQPTVSEAQLEARIEARAIELSAASGDAEVAGRIGTCVTLNLLTMSTFDLDVVTVLSGGLAGCALFLSNTLASIPGITEEMLVDLWKGCVALPDIERSMTESFRDVHVKMAKAQAARDNAAPGDAGG